MASKDIIIKNKADKPFKGARRSRPMKTRKMVQPRCKVHFPGDGSVSPFNVDWEQCKADGHDPYYTVTTVPHVTQLTEVRADGKTYVTGEETRLEYVKTPNWEQVPDELGMYSGRGVPNSIARGYIFPEDLGYAPFCDYLGCGEQNPKFNTRFGNYHSREEAALIAMRLDFGQENATEAQFLETDGARLNQQLREKAAQEGF